MATRTKVKKWGTNIAVVIPVQFAKSRQIEVGTVLDLESVRVVSPKRRRYKLKELMARFKPEHRHGEWALGGAVGRESW